MTSKSPVFPISPTPQHFSDYGFDPQIDYFQVLEEARKHKRESSSSITSSRSLDALHFKLQKPISKEDSRKNKINKKKKKQQKWWRNAFLFWRWKWVHPDNGSNDNNGNGNATYIQRGALSGPVYITESRSGSATPCRSKPTSGPLGGGVWTPTRKGDLEMPYVSLRELNMEHEHQVHRISTSAMPIYLVT